MTETIVLGLRALMRSLVNVWMNEWIHRDYAMRRLYSGGSPALGVPCIFYAGRFMADWRREPGTRLIPAADLRRLGNTWRRAGLGREA